MKYNTNTHQVSETVPSGIYEGIDYHGEPPADVAARAGWVDVTPPDGVPRKYWVWDGTNIVECDQSTKDAIAAADAAAISDAKDRTAILPDGVQEAFKATIEQVEANKAVTRSILAVMLAKNVITQGQHDAAVVQIPAMNVAAYAARWREMMDE